MSLEIFLTDRWTRHSGERKKCSSSFPGSGLNSTSVTNMKLFKNQTLIFLFEFRTYYRRIWKRGGSFTKVSTVFTVPSSLNVYIQGFMSAGIRLIFFCSPSWPSNHSSELTDGSQVTVVSGKMSS